MDDLYAALPSLSSLTILHTGLQQLPPITPKLTNLYLKDCNLTHFPEDYFLGSMLTIIYITNNRLIEVPNLRSIQATITFIDLSNNFIEDTKMLKGHFKALTRLLLSNNLIRSFAMPLAHFWPKLHYISLGNNKLIKFNMPIHYQNVLINLTNNPLRWYNDTSWTEDCQSREIWTEPGLLCSRQVTLMGITCYPKTPELMSSNTVLITIDMRLLMATLSVSINVEWSWWRTSERGQLYC